MSKNLKLGGAIQTSIHQNDAEHIIVQDEIYEIVWKDPKKLKDHSLQHETYGDVEDSHDWEAFNASIQANGVLEPLMIRLIENNEDEVIAGHRRKYSSIKNNIRKVPCYYKIFKSEDDAILAFDLTNKDRKKLSTTQLAKICQREFEIYERKRAKGEIPELVGKRLATIVAEQLKGLGINSDKQVRDLMKLNKLIPELQALVDKGSKDGLSQERARAFAQMLPEEQQVMYDNLAEHINSIKSKELNNYNVALKTNLKNKEIEIENLEKELGKVNDTLSDPTGLVSMSPEELKDFENAQKELEKRLEESETEQENKDILIKELKKQVEESEIVEIDVTKTPEFLKLLKAKEDGEKHLIERLNTRRKEKIGKYKDETVEVVERKVAELLISLKHLTEYVSELKSKELYLYEHGEEIKKLQEYVEFNIG